MNISGVIVIAIGVVLAIIALRGTQQAVFPSLFGSGGSTPTLPGDPLNPNGPNQAPLGPDGKCPPNMFPLTIGGKTVCVKAVFN